MSRTQTPIAIVGLGALLPGSTTLADAWRDIVSGRDLVTDVPPTHWLVEDWYDPNPAAADKTYAKRGAFLPDVPFDPVEFGVPPSIVPATDTAQLLALMVAQRALEDASGGDLAKLDRERMGCVLGVTSAQELFGEMSGRLQRPAWVKALREAGLAEDQVQSICERIAANFVPWQESTFPGLLGNVVAGRVANRFDLRGTNAVTDAACASSLAALSMAVNELQLGKADLMLTGGVDAMNDPFMFICFSKTPALSPTGDCRPFSDAADGTLLGEGVVMFALKRLADAERDGDRIYAVIRGVGSSSDGRAKSVYAPLPEGQARALRRAYEAAGYGPETVELVEAHGTGTKAGDVAEFEGLRQVFAGAEPKRRQWCALGSIKSQVGHTKAAAGAAGLLKVTLALHHKVLPPTIKVERPNPKLGLEDSPFYLNTAARPWVSARSHSRRASVSAFGFGGSNFHVAVEEYVPTETAAALPERIPTQATELILVSAPDATALAAASRALAAKEAPFAELARESRRLFDPAHPARLAVVAASKAELVEKVGAAVEKVSARSHSAFSTPTGTHFAHDASPGKVAFLFPGQGSQYVGMGADLAMSFDEARAPWDAAAAASFDGTRLHEVVFPKPAFTEAERDSQRARLTATEWAQPAIGVTSASMLALLRALGVAADAHAGHSFGEVTALHAAGAFDAETFVRIARRRGELMRDAAATPGAMTAVSMPAEELRALVAGWKLDVVLANHNSPTQCVLSGPTPAIAEVERRLTELGRAAKRLPVATAFHSSVVAPSSAPFLEFLRSVPVSSLQADAYSNAEAAPYVRDPDRVRAVLAAQIAKPVRFVEEVEALYAAGIRTFVEVGPSSVLTDLVGRILGDRPHLAVSLDRKGKHGLTSLQDALGRLAVNGVRMRFDALWPSPAAAAPVRAKPAMTIPINGTNANRPYPPKGGTSALPKPNPPKPPVVAAAETQNMSAHSPFPAPPPAPGPATAPAFGDDVQLAWVRAYQEMQRQTAEAHAAYQRTTAETHAAFLRASESSMAALAAMLTGQPAPAGALPPTSFAPVASPPLPPPMPAAPVVAAPTASSFPPPGVATAVAPPVQSAPAAAPPRPEMPAGSPALDIEQLLLEIVSEKTGYPATMLGPKLELEADLGIDSIKRVEILSAVRERAPQLAEVNPADLARLRTLGQIAEHLRGSAPAKVVERSVSPAATDVQQLLLEVVAEKTGYPASMLASHLELEADLGIDSIKRVEILSALRERAPGLAEVNPAELAKLRTLGHIAEHLRGGAAVVARSVSEPAPDLEKLLLDVVAEKTGYPVSMLGASMELEADLGIDSIKRVEILSAVRERAPGLAEVNPAELAKLRTLGHIAAHLRGGSPAGATAMAVAPAEAASVARYVVREKPAPGPGLAMRGLHEARRVVVTDDGAGLAEAVLGALEAHGIDAERVATVPPDADAVLFLGGMRPVDTPDAATAVNREAFVAARAVAPRFARDGGLFVFVQDTGGDFGLSGAAGPRAWLAGVAALARTAAREWPHASVKAVDLERAQRSPEELANALVEELLQGGSLLEVGLHADGRRTTLAAGRGEKHERALTFSRRPLVVASGGARGVTAASLVELARRTRPRIVLLGRTRLEPEPAWAKAARDEAGLRRAALEAASALGEKLSPAEAASLAASVLAAREARENVAKLTAAGAEVRYAAVDVQSRPELEALLQDVRASWGPVTVLVHGAGVLADKLLAEKTDAQFAKVFDTKVEGLRALLAATASDPLEAIVLFSSVAARSGNAGQSDYAMANEVLNAVACAERARRPRCVVRSIGWGPWDGGMVTPALKAHFEREGVALIPQREGSLMFADELADSPEAVVVIGGALPSGDARATTTELRVDARNHPEIGDHRIGGVPVVPVALALEWLVRGARDRHPGFTLREVRDLRVLRGIRLDGFDDEGEVFSVSCRDEANSPRPVVTAELRGPSGALHYAATLELAPETELPSLVAPAVPQDLAPWNARRDTYDGHVLFHGPLFQVIRGVDAKGERGLTLRLEGLRARGWPDRPWRTDPALVDGALQAAVLWAEPVLGGATLPMAVGACRVAVAGPVEGTVRALVQARSVSAGRAACDVWLVDEAGRALMELAGIELVLRPGEGARMPAVA